MLELIRTLATIGGCLLALLFVLLAMPQSKLRDFLMPIVGGAFALFCGVYAVSPVDVMPEAILGPFGLFDDAVAVVAGVSSAVAASRAAKRLAAG